jgi:hypothetical protein
LGSREEGRPGIIGGNLGIAEKSEAWGRGGEGSLERQRRGKLDVDTSGKAGKGKMEKSGASEEGEAWGGREGETLGSRGRGSWDS